jgi:cytochrome P450 PksS
LRVLFALFGPLVNNMLNRDPPDHTRLRALVHQAFTPKRVEDLRQRVESLTQELLEAAARRRQWDLVLDYAVPIPTTIIAEMLGVPAGDREKFRRWSNALLLSSATTFAGMASNLPKFMAFLRYLRRLVQERRRNPKDDLISALVAAEETGDRLNEDELLAMVFLLLIAGYETTMNLIGNGALALLENPDQTEHLREHPELMAPAVEEFARYYSPVDYANPRFAISEVTLSGVTVPKGETVIAAIGSANRDERQFERPDSFEMTREPNRHLAFGQGIHYCLGAPLARLEANVAFTTLLRHFRELQLGAPREQLRWRESTLLRGLESLPVNSVVAREARRSSA